MQMIRLIKTPYDGWDLGLFVTRWTRLYFGRFMFFKEALDSGYERSSRWKLAVFIDNKRALDEFDDGASSG